MCEKEGWNVAVIEEMVKAANWCETYRLMRMNVKMQVRPLLGQMVMLTGCVCVADESAARGLL